MQADARQLYLYDGGWNLYLPTLPAAGATYTLVFNGLVPAWQAGGTGGGTTVTIGGSPPSLPTAGSLWWNSNDGNLYIFYDDGTSTQWTTASGQSGPQGPAGPAGPTGLTGPAGANGANGVDGSPDTAAQVLTKIKTVDGAGSGLDADLLDGHDTAYFAPEAPSDGNTYGRLNGTWTEVPGIAGISPTEFTFNTSTTAPPGSGTIRLNNATQGSATTIWVHDMNALNVDVSRAIAMLKTGNTLLVQDKTNANNYQYYRVSAAVTDAGTYTTVPVTWQSGGSNITAGRVMLAAFGLGIGDEVVGGIITIASSAPSSPAVNDVWIDTT
jgi:hypothetical protein